MFLQVVRFGFGPVYAGHAALVMSSVCVFFAVDDDSGMEEGRADRPEDGGKSSRLRIWSVKLLNQEWSCGCIIGSVPASHGGHYRE